jgi:hypothetical protein
MWRIINSQGAKNKNKKMVQTVDVMECGLERTSTSVFPGALTVWFCFSRNVCVLRNPWMWSRWWETAGLEGFPGTVLGKGLADGKGFAFHVCVRQSSASETCRIGDFLFGEAGRNGQQHMIFFGLREKQVLRRSNAFSFSIGCFFLRVRKLNEAAKTARLN